MADYIYTMETRLTPDQQRGVSLVQETARAHEINVYLTGGAIRDLISGLAIRDLDFTVQGNPAKLQKDLERGGAIIQGEDEGLKAIFVLLPGNVRGEIAMARSETYEKPGKRPEIAPATITDDLRRRDFSVNAMALSLNPGSRGLLLDPTNGVAGIEAKLLRVLGNYSFLEDPSRLIRATRLSARFHWQLEERTQARYNTAKEENYIDRINNQAIGYEIESLAYEDDPLHILKALEKEGWLKVLNPHWSAAKVDSAGLAQLMKMRQQMSDLGYTMNVAPAVMYFLTSRLPERAISEMQRLIPRKEFVTSWRRLEDEAKELAKKLTGKEAATPSRAWRVLTEARPETILFLQVTSQIAAAGDDRTAHHALAPGVSQARARRFYATSRWQAALANRDVEIPKALRAAATASSATAQTRARRQGRCRSSRSGATSACGAGERQKAKRQTGGRSGAGCCCQGGTGAGKRPSGKGLSEACRREGIPQAAQARRPQKTRRAQKARYAQKTGRTQKTRENRKGEKERQEALTAPNRTALSTDQRQLRLCIPSN